VIALIAIFYADTNKVDAQLSYSPNYKSISELHIVKSVHGWHSVLGIHSVRASVADSESRHAYMN